MMPIRILGIDPGLGTTGWGLIAVADNHLSPLGSGIIRTDAGQSVPARLRRLDEQLVLLLSAEAPEEAAIEEVFVNRNGASTLKLGYARGVALLALARTGIPVAEYAARRVKQAVVGTGAAAKTQVQMMVRRILPGADCRQADAADALAIAICHAHYRTAPALAGPLGQKLRRGRP